MPLAAAASLSFSSSPSSPLSSFLNPRDLAGAAVAGSTIVTADGFTLSPGASADVLGVGFSTVTAMGRGMLSEAAPISYAAQSVRTTAMRGEASGVPPSSTLLPLMPYFEPIEAFDEDPLVAAAMGSPSLGVEGNSWRTPSQFLANPMLPPLVYRLREREGAGNSSSAAARSGLSAPASGTSINSFPLSSSSPDMAMASQGFRSLPLPAALGGSQAVPATNTTDATATNTTTNFSRGVGAMIDGTPTTAPTAASFGAAFSASSPLFANASSSRNPYLHDPSSSLSVATFPSYLHSVFESSFVRGAAEHYGGVAEASPTSRAAGAGASADGTEANQRAAAFRVAGGVTQGHHSSSILLPPSLPIPPILLGSGEGVATEECGDDAFPFFLLPPMPPPLLLDACGGEVPIRGPTTATCHAANSAASSALYHTVAPFDFGFGGEAPAVATMGHAEGNGGDCARAAIHEHVEPTSQLLSTAPIATDLCAPNALPPFVDCPAVQRVACDTAYLLGAGMGPTPAIAASPLSTPFLRQRQLQHHRNRHSLSGLRHPPSASPSPLLCASLCGGDRALLNNDHHHHHHHYVEDINYDRGGCAADTFDFYDVDAKYDCDSECFGVMGWVRRSPTPLRAPSCTHAYCAAAASGVGLGVYVGAGGGGGGDGVPAVMTPIDGDAHNNAIISVDGLPSRSGGSTGLCAALPFPFPLPMEAAAAPPVSWAEEGGPQGGCCELNKPASNHSTEMRSGGNAPATARNALDMAAEAMSTLRINSSTAAAARSGANKAPQSPAAEGSMMDAEGPHHRLSASSPSFGRALVMCWEDLLQQWGGGCAAGPEEGAIRCEEALVISNLKVVGATTRESIAGDGGCGGYDDSLWMSQAAENVRTYQQQHEERDAGDDRTLVTAALPSTPPPNDHYSPLPLLRHTHPSSSSPSLVKALAIHRHDGHDQQQPAISPSSISKPSSSNNLTVALAAAGALPASSPPSALLHGCPSTPSSSPTTNHALRWAAGDGVGGGEAAVGGHSSVSVSSRGGSSFVDGRRGGGLGGCGGDAGGGYCDAAAAALPGVGFTTRHPSREKELLSSAERLRGIAAPIPLSGQHHYLYSYRGAGGAGLNSAVGSPAVTTTTATPYRAHGTPSSASVFTFTPLRSPPFGCGSMHMAVLSSPFCSDTPPPRPFEIFARAPAAGVGHAVGGGEISAPSSSIVGSTAVTAAVSFLTLSPQQRAHHHHYYGGATTGEEDGGHARLRLAGGDVYAHYSFDATPAGARKGSLLPSSSPWCVAKGCFGVAKNRKGSFSFAEASSTPPPPPPRVAATARIGAGTDAPSPQQQTVADTAMVAVDDLLLGAQPPLLCFFPAQEEAVGVGCCEQDGDRCQDLPSLPSPSSPPLLPIVQPPMPTRRAFAKPPTVRCPSIAVPSAMGSGGGGVLPIARQRLPPFAAAAVASSVAASPTNRQLIFNPYEGADDEEEDVVSPTHALEGSTRRVDEEETIIFVVSDGEESDDADDYGDDETIVAFVRRPSRRLPHGVRGEGRSDPSLLASSPSLTSPLSLHPLRPSMALPLPAAAARMGPSFTGDGDDDACDGDVQIGGWGGADRRQRNVHRYASRCRSRNASTSALSAATVECCAAAGSGSVAGYSDGAMSASMATPWWGAEGNAIAPSSSSVMPECDNEKCVTTRNCGLAGGGGGRSVPFSASTSSLPSSALISPTSHTAVPSFRGGCGGWGRGVRREKGRTSTSFSASFGPVSQSAAAATGGQYTVIKVGALPSMITAAAVSGEGGGGRR